VSPIKAPKSPANWPKIMNENDFDKIIDEPLLTDDGLLNPVCMAQLDAAIKNMPPTHERLAGDDEWSRKRVTYWREITGYLANWAVRQIEEHDNTPFPPGLEKVIGYLSACIRPKFDQLGYAWMSLCDINRLLHDILYEEKIIASWNDANVLPGWLDIDALFHNVCLSIRDERREFDAFNRRFDAENLEYDLGAGI
jgi:hypothetical protein